MKTIHFIIQANKLCFILLLLIIGYSSCNPAIHTFKVEPLTTTSRDSVKINWKVSGKPTLLFHEVDQKEDNPLKNGDVTAKYLEFILSVVKGKNEAHRMVQVAIVPDTSYTEIVFPTVLHGDTLIAAGNKNILRWGNSFKVLSLASQGNRDLLITHSDKTIKVGSGSTTYAFEGTPLEGFWEFRSLLTIKEKEDMSTAPDRFRVKLVIKYKR